MKISANFKKPSINLSGYKAALKNNLVEAMSRATFEWLVAVMGAIPSWSGASRGTLLQLAATVGFHVDISVSQVAQERYGDRTSLGFTNSQGGFDVQGADNGRISFHYSTSLPHLIHNEFNNAMVTPDPTKWRHQGNPAIPPLHNPGPYHFQEKGKKAVQEALSGINVLPDLRQFLTVKDNRV